MATSKQSIRYRDGYMKYFLDTEFVDDGTRIELLSIGLVEENPEPEMPDRTYYAAVKGASLTHATPWVHEHVVPHLPKKGDPAWKTRKQIREDLLEFIQPHPLGIEMWAYYSAYDWVAFCQLFGPMVDFPSHVPKSCFDLKQLAVTLGNPRLPPAPKQEHHALADALWNQEVYGMLRARRS